ncbi:hypothetical protein B0T18DRAFT_425929 [Schizothecium vesticola]|uniref:Uncharacterized protein n=1 Tax=Schizothecium vesticola TaxID=314040 RepID=A0AA40K9R3_9PEZI|nr:hypothetical protein B0T18DRAFT_425929 [Schizothecium vesticola]
MKLSAIAATFLTAATAAAVPTKDVQARGVGPRDCLSLCAYLRIPNPIAYGTCIGVCLSLAEQGEDPVEFIGDGQGGTVFGK